MEKPLNREPPIEDLVSKYTFFTSTSIHKDIANLTYSFITTHDAYDRNHSPIPYLSASTHKVQVNGLVETPFTLSISQLQHDFEQVEVVCALQCAGNRRHTMRTWLKEVDGINWGDGAVMNCRWKGVRLRDILIKAGFEEGVNSGERENAKHVAFACYQSKCEDDEWYGGSITFERAMREDGDVLLALEVYVEFSSLSSLDLHYSPDIID